MGSTTLSDNGQQSEQLADPHDICQIFQSFYRLLAILSFWLLLDPHPLDMPPDTQTQANYSFIDVVLALSPKPSIFQTQKHTNQKTTQIASAEQSARGTCGWKEIQFGNLTRALLGSNVYTA